MGNFNRNPRDIFWNHKERGRQEYKFTYDDLSRITGKSVQTLYRARNRKKFHPEDLESVIHYCAAAMGYIRDK